MLHDNDSRPTELSPSEELAVRDTLEVMLRHLQPDALPEDSRWRETFVAGALALVKALEPDEIYTS